MCVHFNLSNAFEQSENNRRFYSSSFLKCVVLVVIITFTQDGLTALHRAAQSPSVDVIQALVDGKADINAIDQVSLFLFNFSLDAECQPLFVGHMVIFQQKQDHQAVHNFKQTCKAMKGYR